MVRAKREDIPSCPLLGRDRRQSTCDLFPPIEERQERSGDRGEIYARRSTLFWIFPDIAPSFFKRMPPARPPAKLPTDQTNHKVRMRFPWK